MEIRQRTNLLDLYPTPSENIDVDSPELAFMIKVASKDATAISYFEKGRLFRKEPVAVDTPWKRYEGLEGVKDFFKEFLPKFNASQASILPMFQTKGGGRSVSEIVVNFVVDNKINQVAMFIVGDLRTKDSLEEIRMYCHFSFVPGLTPYRKPIFNASHLEMGDPQLLTGAMREYYEALHTMPHCDLDRLIGCMSDDCKFGGYTSFRENILEQQGHQYLTTKFNKMVEYIPHKVAMRYETLIDDGVTAIIEWVHVISDLGRKDLNRAAISGIAAYQRNDEGKLCSIRICDYAGHEDLVDWDKQVVSKEEAYRINAVKEFPNGTGRNKLNKDL